MVEIFKVPPYSRNIARSILKEPKLYFFDTGLVQGGEGAKFENTLAVSLLKHCYGKTDYHAEEYTLHYLRTKDGAEFDFALARQEKIESIIEVRVSDQVPSRTLMYFQEKYQYPALQVVKHLRHEQERNGITLVDATKFLSGLFV